MPEAGSFVWGDMTDTVKKAYDASANAGAKQGRGRWKPGQSGNPAGKARGCRHRATRAALALLAGDLEAVTQALIEKAKAGEQWAVTLMLNKLIPNAKDGPVRFPLPSMEGAHDLRQALSAVLKAVSKGRLTPEEGQAVAQVMNAMGLVMMVEDIEKKLARLQEAKR